MSNYKDYGWGDGANDSHGFIYPSLYKMLQNSKDKRILDLGCGNGEIACRLLDDGFDVYGIDASETGIKIANKKHVGRFFVQDISSQCLPAEITHLEFDMVLSTEVIEHLYAPRDFMKLIRRRIQVRSATASGGLV